MTSCPITTAMCETHRALGLRRLWRWGRCDDYWRWQGSRRTCPIKFSKFLPTREEEKDGRAEQHTQQRKGEIETEQRRQVWASKLQNCHGHAQSNGRMTGAEGKVTCSSLELSKVMAPDMLTSCTWLWATTDIQDKGWFIFCVKPLWKTSGIHAASTNLVNVHDLCCHEQLWAGKLLLQRCWWLQIQNWEWETLKASWQPALPLSPHTQKKETVPRRLKRVLKLW